MRILHCIPSLAGGGAERQLSYLAPELARMGNEVHVAYLHTGHYLQPLLDGGVVTHQITVRNNYDPAIFTGLMNVIRTVRPDVVQTWILQMDILGGLASKLCNIPYVLREPSQQEAYPRGVKTSLREIAGRYASAIVSNSAGGDSYWKSRHSRAQRFVIPNGLPINEISQAPDINIAEFGIDSQERLLVYTGRLEMEKNLPNLLKGCCKAMARTPFVVAICGKGSFRPQLEELVRNLGIADKVVFTGFTEQVWSFQKRANVFAFVSDFEGFPNVLVEAMICGAPLVISDIAAHREIADESMAVFVNGASDQSISDGIVTVLENEALASVRSKLAQQAAAKWSVEAMAVKYETVYEEILRSV